MIPLALYLAFVLATIVVLLIPGPNVALIVSTSVVHGPRAGLMTVAGTSLAMLLQLALTVTGMAALLTISAEVFSVLRAVGVAYLLYLGIRTWRAAPVDLTTMPPPQPGAPAIFFRGLLVSLTNPKTLLFFGAFLPQFVSPASPLLPQLLILSASFLALAVMLDSSWALAAARLRFLLSGNGRLRNRLSGGLLIGAGLGLALTRKN
ncbi:MAG TPA: LysE family translocator [Micropepsaceae bacterium]|nr:LysE family translocator [Micropepsaceae bacterium]